MTIRRRRPGPILVAASLLAAALPTTAAAASTQASLSPKQLPAYAHGSVTGAGPHNGVRLELVAWPKGNFRKGQKVHLRVIGKATSGSSGSYSIHPTVALPNGLHNLEVLARSSVAVGAFSFPRVIRARGQALAVNGSTSTKPVTANIHMMTLPKSEQSTGRHPSGVACDATAIKTREFGDQWVDVGGLFSLMTDGKMQLTYTAGSNTTIGVGVSVPFPGEAGAFTAEGTFTQKSSGTQKFRPVVGKVINEQTPYTFGEYRICFMFQVQPEVWVFGHRDANVKPPLFDKKNCSQKLLGGDVITRKTGTAGTFKAGVDLKKEIGISLSAQSGYSKNVSITYTFPSEGGFLCGTDGAASVASFDEMSPLGMATHPAARTRR